jgi:hypothetical protein
MVRGGTNIDKNTNSGVRFRDVRLGRVHVVALQVVVGAQRGFFCCPCVQCGCYCLANLGQGALHLFMHTLSGLCVNVL